METRSSLRGVLAALLCVAPLAAGCGAGEESPPAAEPSAAAEAPEPSPPAAEAPEAPAAPAAADAEPPMAGGDAADADVAAADPEQGAALYQQYCAACHGPEGRGDGPAGMALDPRPVSHADGSYMNALSNEHLFTVIKEGGPAVGKSPLMAPWGGSLDDEQIRDVVAFVRTLAEPPYTGPMP